MYYDLHTHTVPPPENKDVCAIVNVSAKHLHLLYQEKDKMPKIGINYLPWGAERGHHSIGIHPWFITEENVWKELDLIEKYAGLSNVKAIGECGLDKLCKTDFNLQKEVFLSQITISEKAGRPLIIHCVKSLCEIIDLKKRTLPKQTWIIHGFRGKPEQAIQLTNLGFYLSFGLNYNEETIKQIPIEKLFLETDNGDCNIQTIYQKVAKTLGISEQNLILQIERNAINQAMIA